MWLHSKLLPLIMWYEAIIYIAHRFYGSKIHTEHNRDDFLTPLCTEPQPEEPKAEDWNHLKTFHSPIDV